MKPVKTTQLDRVMRHLLEEGSITSLEAFQEYGITRLSAVIFVLREVLRQRHIQCPYFNVTIDNEWIIRKNRYGEDTHFVKYTLTNRNA